MPARGRRRRVRRCKHFRLGVELEILRPERFFDDRSIFVQEHRIGHTVECGFVILIWHGWGCRTRPLSHARWDVDGNKIGTGRQFATSAKQESVHTRADDDPILFCTFIVEHTNAGIFPVNRSCFTTFWYYSVTSKSSSFLLCVRLMVDC